MNDTTPQNQLKIIGKMTEKQDNTQCPTSSDITWENEKFPPHIASPTRISTKEELNVNNIIATDTISALEFDELNSITDQYEADVKSC